MTTEAPKIGLVGAGGISHSHLPHLLRLGAEVYVHSDSGAPELVRQYGGTAVGSFEELLEQVDFVDVATPTQTHFGIIKAALSAGKDVISEKPLTRLDEEADALIRLAESLGRKLYPAHVVRYFPEYVQLHDAVMEGTLGELAVLKFSRAGATPAGVPWFANKTKSGGIIMDQMIHDIDIARWVAGEIEEVSAVTAQADGHFPAVASAHVLLTHASGAISQISGFWGPPHLKFSTAYSVTGTKGQLTNSTAREQNFLPDFGGPVGGGGLVPEVDPDESPYYLQLKELMGALQGGPAPRVTALDGLEAVRLANAAIESSETGQPVSLHERILG